MLLESQIGDRPDTEKPPKALLTSASSAQLLSKSHQPSMSDPSSTSGDGNSVAKTAGLVVFSGIAMSILKALNPFNKNRNEQTPPLAESTQPIQFPSQPPLPPQQQPITVKEPHPPLRKTITRMDQNVEVTPKSSHKTIEIEKGDTLWGLSREHGVSIDAIKEANGLTGDTIYAGKKLIIP